MMEEKLNLTQQWDKTFPKSDRVDHKKVTFVTRYGVTLAADLYTPKNKVGKLPAVLRPVRPDDGGAGLPDHRL